MNDFFNSQVSWLVAGVTLFSVLVCAVLLWIQTSKKVRVSLDEQTNSTGHVWDEDLKELNNPMPRWWVGLFYLTVVFGLGYLCFFPGLTVYQGHNDWSSAAQYQAEKLAVQERAKPVYSRYEAMSLEEISSHDEARGIGERLFLNNCAQCHGSDARGGKGFPNLTDSDWLYGGQPETILASIKDGRHGLMPPMVAAVGGEDNARAVAQYVLSLSGRENDSLKAQLGRELFANNCAACHGAEGKGNQILGAPDLSDRIWLHGGTERAIVQTIREGRSGEMPAHDKLLTEQQARVLASYVWSMSN